MIRKVLPVAACVEELYSCYIEGNAKEILNLIYCNSLLSGVASVV